METSFFLAKLIGPVLIVIGLGLLVKQSDFREMATDFLSSRAMIFLAGLLTLEIATQQPWVWPSLNEHLITRSPV